MSDQGSCGCEEPIALFCEDTDVTSSRPPGAIIGKPSDLTHHEKLLLEDLFQRYVKMPGQDHGISASPELYKEFFSQIFKYWVSTHTVNPRAVLQPQNSQQTRIEIDASWISNEPPASFVAKCRERKKRHVMVSLTMEFCPEEELLVWELRDARNRELDLQDLEDHLFGLGVTKNVAILMAIENHDNIERMRVASYNRDQIVSAARRRICKWARAGSSHDGMISIHDQIYGDNILPLDLAGDVYIKNARDAAEIAAAIEKRRSMFAA